LISGITIQTSNTGIFI